MKRLLIILLALILSAPVYAGWRHESYSIGGLVFVIHPSGVYWYYITTNGKTYGWHKP